MWHGTFADLNQNINMLATQFGKPVLVVETAYPFTLSWNDNTNNILGLETQLLDDYEASEEGQFSFLYDLISLVHDNDFGYGICYWAPDWISTSQFGSPWENQALFDFDGQLLDAVSVFDDANVSVQTKNEYSIGGIFNYPNPFNPVTKLRYTIPKNSLVSIIIYDMLGRQVKTLVNQTQNAGYASVIWDATNDYGKPVSAGIYLYQIQTGEYIQTKKMVLLK